MIIVIGGEKGGTGKTTIAVNLAVMRQKVIGDIILVDAEPTQASASKWCAYRDEGEIKPRITCVNKKGKYLKNDLLDLSKKYSDVIVDTGGQDSVELRGSLLVANVFISPLRPSQFDIWTLNDMNKLVGDCKMINEKIRGYVVLNMAPTNPLVDDAIKAAEWFRNENFDHLHLLAPMIHERRIYQKAVRDGLGVHEVSIDGKAERELNNVYDAIFSFNDCKEEVALDAVV